VEKGAVVVHALYESRAALLRSALTHPEEFVRAEFLEITQTSAFEAMMATLKFVSIFTEQHHEQKYARVYTVHSRTHLKKSIV
jgi:hypothetical protein